MGNMPGPFRSRLGEQVANGSDESVLIDMVEELSLPTPERRRFHLIPRTLVKQRNDGFGAVGFIAGPLGALPSWGEDWQHDAARFAAGLNFLVPVVAVTQTSFVKPDSQARCHEAVVECLCKRQVRRRVANEAVVRHAGVFLRYSKIPHCCSR